MGYSSSFFKQNTGSGMDQALTTGTECLWEVRMFDVVIPGWSKGPDPESRDSGFDASHRPGMTDESYAAFSTFSTPRRIWSSSIDSNSALKLPSPKPSSPLRSMNSKKIGPMALAEKICKSTLV